MQKIMEENKKKDSTLAGLIGLFGSIIFIIIGINEGWNLNGQIFLGIGVFLGIIGGISFKNPEIGHAFHQFLQNWGRNIEKENSSVNQNMHDSPKSQQAGRDLIVNNIIKENGNLSNTHSGDSEEKAALREIYKKMVKALTVLNSKSNKGIKSNADLNEVAEAVAAYQETVRENRIEIDSQMETILSEVLGAFRYTSHELNKRLQAGNQRPLLGLKAYDFIFKCDQVTLAIKKKLKKD